MRHAAMPCVSGVELRRRRHIEKKVSQRGLEGIEREVQEVEGNDSEANCRVIDLMPYSDTHLQ